MSQLFKIRDLMIRVGAPGPVDAAGGIGACFFCTGMDSCGSCTFCTASSDALGSVVNPPLNIAVLKAQLQQQLEYIESIENGFAPSSPAEAEALEKRLHDAAHDLEHMKGRVPGGQGQTAPIQG